MPLRCAVTKGQVAVAPKHLGDCAAGDVVKVIDDHTYVVLDPDWYDDEDTRVLVYDADTGTCYAFDGDTDATPLPGVTITLMAGS